MPSPLSSPRRLKLVTWRIPLAYIAAAVIAGMILPRIEHYFIPDFTSSMSVSAATAIASSIASGMISLTGIVFSLTFVMVQFSATAYSPRLVLWVARDPVIFHALGIFSATFLYALIMLAWVDRAASGNVPMISTWLVMGLLLASMGVFIALIDRISMLQVNRMLIFTGNHGRKAIDDLYSLTKGLPPRPADQEYRKQPITQSLVHAGRPRVIQMMKVPELVKLASEHAALIEATAAVGDTILEGTTLLRVYGARTDLSEKMLKTTIDLGDERTFEQDPKYAIRLVVDIAIKALSPAINDPTTAVQALDQIEDLLLRLGHRHLDIGEYRDDQGTLRLIIPFPSWEDFLRLGLDEIRYCGGNSVQVMRRMKALIKNLLSALPPERHASLNHWERRIQATIGRSFADTEEKQEASVADRQGLGLGESNLADEKNEKSVNR